MLKALIRDDVRERVDKLELGWNEYDIDRYGITKSDVALMYSLFYYLYYKYFDLTVEGIEHIPAKGRAMVVGNHSGGYAIDGMMVVASLFFEPEPPRLAQGMAEKFLNRIPFASLYTNRTGNFTGVPEIAEHLLNHDRMLMVFPEGARGTAKLYGDRNTLVRFGTGFIRLAMRTQTPIVPFAFVGAGEAVPTIMNLHKLGRLFGVPYIPVTPYILPIPKPVPLRIIYGKPIVIEGSGTEPDEEIHKHVRAVRDTIRDLIQTGYEHHREHLK